MAAVWGKKKQVKFNLPQLEAYWLLSEKQDQGPKASSPPNHNLLFYYFRIAAGKA